MFVRLCLLKGEKGDSGGKSEGVDNTNLDLVWTLFERKGKGTQKGNGGGKSDCVF